ncbi:MAG: serine hydrolase domain-containing protein [Pseudomonadota bacterium]
MLNMRLGITIATVILLAACENAANDPTDEPSPVTVAAATIAPIKSSEMVIQFQIRDAEPRDWTITPDLSPDTLTFECLEGETVPVTFTTDIESRTIPITIEQESLQFDIIVNDDITALTELKCIEELARYRGDFSPDRDTAGDYETDIGAVLQTYFQSDKPGIILSISEGGVPVYESAIGIADMTLQTERRLDEAFDLASVSKELTAISILQLVEQGKLSIDDPLSAYFDDLPNGDEITLHHLLTHTHGLPQIRTAEDYDDSIPRELEVALGHIRDQGARFAPGERYDYGNTSYYLLSVIAEMASGIDRKTYLREKLLAPAGMTESFLFTEDPDPARRVSAYNEIDGEMEPRDFDFSWDHIAGAGELVSTIEDLRRWQRAVSNGTLISAQTFELATAPKTLNDGTELARGYGFFRGTLDGELIIYNTGDFFTHTRHFYMPSRDISIILNTNGTPQYDGGQSSIVWLQVVGKFFDRQTVEMFDDVIDLNDL